MRRDVSMTTFLLIVVPMFSLHVQRCFYISRKITQMDYVFSACAEMFPVYSLGNFLHLCFLCMRRDVSESETVNMVVLEFSLHAQRCFYRIFDPGTRQEVFSACAEMFPSSL